MHSQSIEDRLISLEIQIKEIKELLIERTQPVPFVIDKDYDPLWRLNGL